jgi:quinol monooxygenase YgiN
VISKLLLLLNTAVACLKNMTQRIYKRRYIMVTVGLLVRVEAKPGKEGAVENFLRGALPLAQGEPATTTWYAIRLGPSTFGVFDTFPNEAGRQAHLSGPIAAALMANAAELLAQPPSIEQIDILAAKIPG